MVFFMYIIIVGGGSVGFYLCKELLNEGHEVLVIEKDARECECFGEELGSVCIRGDGCETATLAEAGASRADIFIATTNEDEDNLVACQVAKHKFDVPRTIAQINNPKNEAIFRRLGIDCLVSVTTLILEHIEEEIPTHSLIHLLTLRDEEMEIVEVRIPQGSAAIGKSIKELKLPPDSILSLVIRNGQRPQVPSMDTVLEVGDRFIALTATESEETLRLALAGS